MATRRRQPEVTRAQLLQAARQRFGTVGFAATSMEDLVRSVGVTKGALYHHFAGKEELFRAVVDLVITESVEKVSIPQVITGDAWDATIEGMLSYLDLCLEPGNLQILVLDAPAVLGLSAVGAIAEGALGRRWEVVLRSHMRFGLIDRLPVAALGHLLATAVTEASVFVAGAAEPKEARKDAGRVLSRIMNGLRCAGRSSDVRIGSC